MAEAVEPEGAEEAEPVFDTSAAGIAVALDEARDDPSLREDVAGFLAAQVSLIELQKHHLKAQFGELRLREVGAVVKLALQSLTLAAILGLVVLLGVMVRDAMNADGLVVASFSAPPSFADRGLTGEVLGADLASRMAAVQHHINANSMGHSGDVRADKGGETVKLEIPETGISLGEVARYLRGWLGHERRLTADLRDEGAGMASITVVVSGDNPITVRGPAADLDGLMTAAAEKAFSVFDRTNYIIYLGQMGRQAEAFQAAEQYVLAARTPLERATAYSDWAAIDPDRARGLRKVQLAILMEPASMSGWFEGITASNALGHDEAFLAFCRGLAKRRQQDQLRSLWDNFPGVKGLAQQQARQAVGDYEVTPVEAQLMRQQLGVAIGFAWTALPDALRHDAAGASRQIGLAQTAGFVPPNIPLETRWAAAAAGGDWATALRTAQALVALAQRELPQGTAIFVRLSTEELPHKYRPWLALAEARTGDIAGAQALAAMGPLDCYLCVRVRGQVAEAAGDRAGADRWFAEAVRQGPSLPFAHLEWGQAKLARGDAAGAIAEFARAHVLSPRFADPLEAWGEALAATGHAGGAAAKYAEADRITPKWGRLHLKWGEALAKQGRTGDARAQFRTAAGLYLSGPDRAELAAQRT